MENTIDTQQKIYKHLALWPIAVFFAIGIVSDPDAGRSVILMLILFALLASGIVGSGRLALGGHGRLNKAGYGGLCVLYSACFAFILGYHFLRLSGNL